eukprot:TRINITY_DN1758_c0_g3_i3.p1 TRINITY_DN1758_c0_g3~~TRINITY_DN1758_c0_g3_i3.p1  ORF type:complete len:841 (+),score=207.27 TRINITY_DN1758_c0_g3_i3:101-2623(+)
MMNYSGTPSLRQSAERLDPRTKTRPTRQSLSQLSTNGIDSPFTNPIQSSAISFNPSFLNLPSPPRKGSSIDLKASAHLPHLFLSQNATLILKQGILSGSLGQETFVVTGKDLGRDGGVVFELDSGRGDAYDELGIAGWSAVLQQVDMGEAKGEGNCTDRKLLQLFAPRVDARSFTGGIDDYLRRTQSKRRTAGDGEVLETTDCADIISAADQAYLSLFRLGLILVGNDETKFDLEKLIHFPHIDFRLHAMAQPFKVVGTPLTKLLTKKIDCDPRTAVKFGFLTLDQSHRLMPLLVSDPLAKKVPLLGVWIKGVKYKRGSTAPQAAAEAQIWSVLTNYIVSSAFPGKYVFNGGTPTFVLLIFGEESTSFYEVEVLTGRPMDCRWLFLRNSQEVTRKELRGLDLLELEFYFSETLVMAGSTKRPLSLSSTVKGKGRTLPARNIREFSVDTDEVEHVAGLPAPTPPPGGSARLEESIRTACFLESQANSFMPELQRGRGEMEWRMNPLAERMLVQQAEQMKFLQQQILELQSALLSSQRTAQLLMSGGRFCPSCSLTEHSEHKHHAPSARRHPPPVSSTTTSYKKMVEASAQRVANTQAKQTSMLNDVNQSSPQQREEHGTAISPSNDAELTPFVTIRKGMAKAEDSRKGEAGTQTDLKVVNGNFGEVSPVPVSAAAKKSTSMVDNLEISLSKIADDREDFRSAEKLMTAANLLELIQRTNSRATQSMSSKAAKTTSKTTAENVAADKICPKALEYSNKKMTEPREETLEQIRLPDFLKSDNKIHAAVSQLPQSEHESGPSNQSIQIQRIKFDVNAKIPRDSSDDEDEEIRAIEKRYGRLRKP